LASVPSALLVGSLAWLYAGTARALAVQWFSSADASYGLILASVAVAIAFRRRHLLPVRPLFRDGLLSSTAGLFVLVSGCALLVAGTIAADLFTTRFSFIVVTTGLIWFLAGRQAVRAFAAPLLFLVLAIPLPELIVNAITLPLQLIASRIAETALLAAGTPVIRDGNVLTLPRMTLQVAEACSGLRSAVSLVSVGVLLAWASRGTFLRKAAVVAAAVPVAVLANGLRIAAAGFASEAWGPAAAGGMWHELMGWLTFVACLSVLLEIQHQLDRATLRSAFTPSMVQV
jgi:exosortase